ncbi:MAG: PAS domain S-box protein [Rhodothermia bacterium]|nr:PAS domain S-box protein [Rhodothermia bacterium]
MEKIIELMQAVGDGAFAIDRLQSIVFWNDACERILGYRADEVLGRHCYEVIGGTAEDGCPVCKRDCAAMQARAHREALPSKHLAVHHRDGREIWLGVSTILVPSSWSELSVMVHLIRDITTHKRIESLVGELTGEIAELTATSQSTGKHPMQKVTITDRERQILLAMSSGKTSPEIAELLNISIATVRNHIHHILSKLGVRNRLEAVILSLRAGLL